MSTTIAEYSATDAALADLRTKYEGAVYDVTTPKGMVQAKAARAELRDLRVTLEKTRKEIKEPALRRCQQIDSEAKRITAELSSLEDPIDEQIKAEEQRKERARAEAERLERERVAALHARFEEIRSRPQRTLGAEPDAIRAILAEAEAVDPATFPDDHRDAARYERQLAINAIRAALDRAEVAAAERAELERLRAEQEALRQEQAALQAERERLAAAERERQAAEERRLAEQARAEQEAVERAAREAREAEQRRIDAERAEQRRQEDAARAAEEQRLREERAQLEAELAAATRREREDAIANATLLSAASEALAFLQAEGYGDLLVTQKLEAAIRREPAPVVRLRAVGQE